MSTATVPPPTVHRVPAGPSPAVGDASAARAFLIRYGATLLPLLVALVVLQCGWQLFADDTWASAAAAVTGWALASVGWLRRRGWRTRTALAVPGVPAVVLAGPIALGWLSSAGLVLWSPVSTVLAVAVVTAERPLPPPTSPPAGAPAPA